MLKRIVRSALTFAAVFAAYQTYALVAVPWMDPPIKERRLPRVPREDMAQAESAVFKYQLLLSNYFPKDHWSQKLPPKVIASASGDGMFVMDDFERQQIPGGTG